MENFTFEQLPQAISLLHAKMDRLEHLLAHHHPQEESELILNITQAAAFLHLSVATLYSKVSRREIPVSKQGKRLYFHKAELAEWVRQGRKKTLAEIKQEANTVVSRRRG